MYVSRSVGYFFILFVILIFAVLFIGLLDFIPVTKLFELTELHIRKLVSYELLPVKNRIIRVFQLLNSLVISIDRYIADIIECLMSRRKNNREMSGWRSQGVWRSESVLEEIKNRRKM